MVVPVAIRRTIVAVAGWPIARMAQACPGQKPHQSDLLVPRARMRSVSVKCAGVSGGCAHDRREEGDRDASLDRDMTRPAHAGSREQAEADPDDDQVTR